MDEKRVDDINPIEKILLEMDKYYGNIRTAKLEIARLKKEKAEQRNRYWGEATGIAKEKEDYIKAMTSMYDKDIREAEAEIEYAYNMINTLD